MYSLPKLATKFIRYYLTAGNGKGHGIHSPFVFDFIKHVLNDQRHFYAYDKIERIRQSMLQDNRVLQIEDFGAGSTVMKTNRRKISTIASSSLKPKKYGQLMMRMVNKYAVNNIIELGTSLGITTSYLANGNLQGKVYTLEGSDEIAKVAQSNFDKLQLNNIEIIKGNFDNTLQPIVKKIKQIDLAFVDGNHRKEPTLKYFEQLLPHASENSIFIFDDIHWSEGMEEAWKQIQQHPGVTLTIDLFFIGIVFFRKEQKIPQHFSIRF